MSATNFKTENNTYRKLIGNGLTYHVPRFQRDYSWTEEEWEDLWADILDTVQEGGEPAHYMGYLVLQSQDEKRFDVIDGQQRLTTLSIIALAVLKNLSRIINEGKNPDQNKQRLEQIRNTYIGYLDPITLVTRSKLTLNRNNDGYFQTYLVPLTQLPIRGFRASEHSLRKAFEWYEKRVKAYTEQQTGDHGIALASLIETMSDRLFFTVISVTDDLNAYKVFETLNARGVRLSSTDLLKNYLFSVLHKQNEHTNEMNSLEDRWESMVSRLGAESFPDFLRSHWNSRKTFVRQSDLFKTIRNHVTDRASVFDLLRDMEADMDTYLALTHPESSHWASTLKTHAQQLKMFRVRQPFPLILSARRVLNDDQFSKVLRGCSIIAFRYNVIGNCPTNEPERVYYNVARKINVELATTAQEILVSLGELYLKDDLFKALFSEKIIRTTDSRNNRVLRYILCELEKQSSGRDYDFESDLFSVEHILPQNPESGWEQFTDEEASVMVYRIGNMTLLAKGDNKTIANHAYSIKRSVLTASEFGLTKKLAEENEDWTPSRIANRQKYLAKLATAIWRVDQLS